MQKKTKTVSPRLTREAHAFLGELFGTPNKAGEALLGAFPRLYVSTLREIRRKWIGQSEQLTLSCLRLLIDLFEEQKLDAENLGRAAIRLIDDHLAAGTGKVVEKWGREEMGRVRPLLLNLTVFETACLEVWAASYWLTHARATPKAVREHVKPLLAAETNEED